MKLPAHLKESDIPFIVGRLARQWNVSEQEAREVYLLTGYRYQDAVDALRRKKEIEEEEKGKMLEIRWNQWIVRHKYQTFLLPLLRAFMDNPAIDPLMQSIDAILLLNFLIEKNYFVDFSPTSFGADGERFTSCHLYRLSGRPNIHADGADCWEALVFAVWYMLAQRKEEYGV